MEEKRDTKEYRYDISEEFFREKPDEAAGERRRRRAEIRERRSRKYDPELVKARARSRRHIAGVFIVIIVFLAVTANILYQSYTLRQEKRAVEEKLLQLQRKQAELEERLRQINTDEYVEQAARSELHMIKNGETMYVIDKDPSSGSGEDAP